MIHYFTTNGIGNAWVANELGQVRRAGVPFMLHSMRREAGYHLADWAVQLDRETQLIYPVRPLRVAGAVLVAPLRFGARFFGALANAMFGERESLRGRIASLAHLAVACDWAWRYRNADVRHIHSQWVHSCGTIAMYSAWLLGRSFSFTGHAADLFRERCALRDKIRRADFIVCISTFHREFFLQEGARPEQLKLVYCGIDVDHFAPAAGGQQPSDGVLRIRSSGRLVEKKGFRYLIDACKLLVQAGVKCECVIAGSGPLEGELRSQVEHLGGGRWVTITGQALKQENIPAFMHSGDVYVLPCVWASDNDVDGLPQMLMEAMACGLPVISTHLVGIPDLIIDGQTGLLVEPNDAEQLASAIWRIGRDHALALQLATAGRQRVLDKFNLTTCLQPLIAAYRTRLERMSSTSQVPGPATA